MTSKGSIAILCAGGPAPGINTVVGAVTKSFLNDGWRVIGLNYGFKTIFTDKPDTVEMDHLLADRIFTVGGSFLKMSRHKPKDTEFSADFFVRNGVELLVTIGGDDTASTANRLTKWLVAQKVQVRNIHVPKTIDNDLPLPGRLPTFGYRSAQNDGARIAMAVYEDARTSGNWFTVSMMGREAGHLAWGIGNACHYPLIIIPEMFTKVDITFDRMIRMMVGAIVKRKLLGMNYGAIAVSEGVFHFMTDDEIKSCGVQLTFDDHGHPELGNVSKAHIFNALLGARLKELKIGVKSRPVEIGYEIRCNTPIAFDLEYCTALGVGVKRLYEQGATGCIVVVGENGAVAPLYLNDIAGADGKVKTRMVDINADDFRMLFDAMHFLRPADYAAAKKYLPDPENYDLVKILGW